MDSDTSSFVLGRERTRSIHTFCLAFLFGVGTVGLFLLSSRYPELLSRPAAIGIFLGFEALAVLTAGVQAYRNDGWIPALSVALAPLLGTLVPFGITLSKVALIVGITSALVVSAAGSGFHRVAHTP